MHSSSADPQHLASADAPALTGSWRRRLLWIVALWALTLLAYRDTAWTIVSTWIESETYSHGFLVLPISLWLVWDQRARLLSQTPQTSLAALAAIALAAAAWFAGSLVFVQVVQQFALVFMLIALVWLCIGTPAARTMVFPLAYLLFAVPVGEALVPPLMELTATQTVELVRMTGIPVYREGLYFSLPTGNWSVVRACSGIRYLIASLALGTLFAYITYRSLTRRVLFIAAATIVPIVANVLRAYIIVMLGHLSGMKIATGVDHLIYGWLFFGLVMLLLFWGGSFFAQAQEGAARQRRRRGRARSGGDGGHNLPPARNLLALGGAVALVLLFPLLVQKLDSDAAGRTAATPTLRDTPATWEPLAEPPWSWRPPLRGADAQMHSFFRQGDRLFGISVGVYVAQRQGAEMISDRNGLVEKGDSTWKISQRGVAPVATRRGTFDAATATISGEGHRLALLSWYRIGAFESSNQYVAKLKELLDKASFRDTVSTQIVIYTETEANEPDVASVLQTLGENARPLIASAVARATDQAQ
jgi:exosortase A